VHDVAPQARVAIADMNPVGGSLLLAARACNCGDELDPPLLAQLIEQAVIA
jgi:hypothetical protein